MVATQGEQRVSGGGSQVSPTPQATYDATAEAVAAERRRQTLFLGNGEYSIDEKGRVTLPAHLRRPFLQSDPPGGLLKVMENRVALWTHDTYADAIDSLNRLVTDGVLIQDQVRVFLTLSQPFTCDAQGRLVLPPKIREQAGIDKDVFIAGCGPRVELWQAGRYEAEMLLADDGDDVANELIRLNF